MINAGGDPQAFAKAQSMMTAAVVGFILVLAAYIIVRVVETSTGVNILS